MLKFAAGVAVGVTLAGISGAAAYMATRVEGNGVLEGYVVQRGMETICENPTVWVQFRGPESYIVCD